LTNPLLAAYDGARWLPEICNAGGDAMTWETPAFVDVKMDAEINSYQDDFDREQDDRF
jgi:hypothetical protein